MSGQQTSIANMKFENEAGEILSLGGDDNCGTCKDSIPRLSVCFFNNKEDEQLVNNHKIVLKHQLDYEKECQVDVNVWNDPVKFLKMLAEHYGYELTKQK